jgi:hypothetical protein
MIGIMMSGAPRAPFIAVIAVIPVASMRMRVAALMKLGAMHRITVVIVCDDRIVVFTAAVMLSEACFRRSKSDQNANGRANESGGEKVSCFHN